MCPCANSNGPNEQIASKVLAPHCEITRSGESGPSAVKKRRCVQAPGAAGVDPTMSQPRNSLKSFGVLAGWPGGLAGDGGQRILVEIESQFQYDASVPHRVPSRTQQAAASQRRTSDAMRL